MCILTVRIGAVDLVPITERVLSVVLAGTVDVGFDLGFIISKSRKN